MSETHRKSPVGEALVAEGVITEDQLARAVEVVEVAEAVETAAGRMTD